jgi:hypothetical protein
MMISPKWLERACSMSVYSGLWSPDRPTKAVRSAGVMVLRRVLHSPPRGRSSKLTSSRTFSVVLAGSISLRARAADRRDDPAASR